MPRSATVKPDARISRRDGRDARPCPRTRHTPRRTGTAHVCQHPTTSPAPATLRHFRVVSFEVHFGCFCSSKPWQFYCWHAVASRNTKATHTAEQRGIQHLASLASSIRSGQLEPPSLSRRTNDVTNDAPWVPVMRRVLNMKITRQVQLQIRPLKDSGLPKEIHMSKRSLRACSKQRLPLHQLRKQCGLPFIRLHAARRPSDPRPCLARFAILGPRAEGGTSTIAPHHRPAGTRALDVLNKVNTCSWLQEALLMSVQEGRYLMVADVRAVIYDEIERCTPCFRVCTIKVGDVALVSNEHLRDLARVGKFPFLRAACCKFEDIQIQHEGWRENCTPYSHPATRLTTNGLHAAAQPDLQKAHSWCWIGVELRTALANKRRQVPLVHLVVLVSNFLSCRRPLVAVHPRKRISQSIRT